MSLWLAVDKELNSLGVTETETSDQAFYQFMTIQIYPDNVVLLPNSLMLINDKIDALYDPYHTDD